MCLAVPHRIEELCGDGSAIATAGPIRRSIRVDALPGAQVGDLVLVHAGFAIERLNEEQAQQNLEAAKEVEDALRELYS